MSGKDLTLMDAAVQKMRWHEERQKVISKNIANIDTVGYKGKDLKPLSFKELLRSSSSPTSVSAATTNAKHMNLDSTPVSSSTTSFKQVLNKQDIYSTGSVDIENELMKMNQNYTDHRLTTTIYQKNIDMIKRAIKSQ